MTTSIVLRAFPYMHIHSCIDHPLGGGRLFQFLLFSLFELKEKKKKNEKKLNYSMRNKRELFLRLFEKNNEKRRGTKSVERKRKRGDDQCYREIKKKKRKKGKKKEKRLERKKMM